MENAWSPAAKALGLPKDSINCMLGIWAISVNTEALSVVSGGPADGAGHWARVQFKWGEKTLIDWVHLTRLLDNVSWRPMHDYVMAHEHVAVASMHFIISRLQILFQVLDCKTDALNLKVEERNT